MGNKLHQCSQVGCHKLIDFEVRYCDEHKRNFDDSSYNKARRTDVRTKSRINFYKTAEWKHVREFVWQRDNGLCQYHQLVGEIVTGTIVDHVVPLEFDESLRSDDSNLVVTCKQCHNIKTNWEQNYYKTGFSNKIDKNAVKIKNIENLKFLFEKNLSEL